MWTCAVCAVPCQDSEKQCPACETWREGCQPPPPENTGPKITFGGGAPLKFETNVPNPFAASPLFGVPAGTTNSIPLPSHNPFTQTGPITFGAAPPITFGTAAPAAASAVSSTGDASTSVSQFTFGAHRPTDASRFTFGKSDPLQQGDLRMTPSQDTPSANDKVAPRSPSAFCAALQTPAPSHSEGPLLLNVDPDFKVEPAAANYLTAEEGAVYTWGSGECDQLAVRAEHIDDDGVRRMPIVIKKLAKPFVSRVCCGTMHSAAIADFGKSLYTWGCNDEGALGRPVKTMQVAGVNIDTWISIPPPAEGPERHHAKVPGPIWNLPGDAELRAVSAGDSHTAVITTAGDCFCWGAYRDSWGPIGFPLWDGRHTPKQSVPMKIPSLRGSCMELVSGENHTAVVTYSSSDKRERLFVFGSNDFGQLGLQPSTAADEAERRRGFMPIEWTIDKFEFKEPSGRKDENEATVLLPHADNHLLKARGSLLRVFAGRCTTFFTVDLDGEVRTFGFGRNSCGELGCGTSDAFIKDPVEVKALKGCRWKDIRGGDWFTMGLSHDGSVFTWGHREYVGLGRRVADGKDNVLVPTPVMGLKQRVRAINAGSKTAYALTMDGQVFAWGDNQVAQIGDGSDCDDPVHTPTYVAPRLFAKGYVIDIAGGAQHAIALVKHFAEGELSVLRGEKRKRGAAKTTESPDDSVNKRARLSAPKHSDVFGGSQQTPAQESSSQEITEVEVTAPPATPCFAEAESIRPTGQGLAGQGLGGQGSGGQGLAVQGFCAGVSGLRDEFASSFVSDDKSGGRPTFRLPVDVTDERKGLTPIILAAETRVADARMAELDAEPDSVPQIKRPLPAPPEAASPILTSAAKRQKLDDDMIAHADEFSTDHDADVSNNLEASQPEESPSDLEAQAAHGQTQRQTRARVARAKSKQGTKAESKAGTKAETRAKVETRVEPKAKKVARKAVGLKNKAVDATISEREALDEAEAEQELDAAPATKARPKAKARAKRKAASPPKRVTRSRAAKQ